ncbi:MAG TPA: LuxR C-terminal-related transcriptional regulator [Candidatus Sulfotelmatobacter sp.]|nr:LuxR C-terminal-related transcriptional regulator [Candidatus Sulfotelmatobacter sp.]
MLAQYEGDVDGAIALLQRGMRRVVGEDRAFFADVLGPILVMRHDSVGLQRCADALHAAGWLACADVFRALIALEGGSRRVARRRAARARAALEHETNDLVRARVLHRLARVAFLLNDHAEALDAARASAGLCAPLQAWRLASTSHSIIYSIHRSVTGNLAEADLHATLWREMAERSDDASMELQGLIAEYDLAVHLADESRVATIEKRIVAKNLPQQYVERFPYAISYATVRGWSDMRAMQTLLEVLLAATEPRTSKSALCRALIALAAAARHEDVEARDSVRRAVHDLAHSRPSGPAYERWHRRMARAAIAAACLLLGDDVRAQRVLTVRESRHGEGEDALPALMRAGRLGEAPRSLHGLARVFARAAEEHRLQAVPADLTIAQFEVLQLLGRGWSAQRIAEETGRTRNTVYNHTRAILAKFEARRAAEAVAIARQRGIIA